MRCLESRGLGAPWHLDHVEILSQATGERTYFIAEKWLDKKLGTSVIVLEPASAPGQKQTYKVSLPTSYNMLFREDGAQSFMKSFECHPINKASNLQAKHQKE
jgi:hypothetical protein